MPRLRTLRLAAAPLVVALGLAACGGDDGEQADAPVTPPPLTSTQPPAPRTTPTPTTTTATATTPAPPLATTPTPADGGGGATPTTPAPRSPDTGGAQAPRQDDPSAQPDSRQTGGSTGPASCGEAIGGFIRGIAASGGADCGQATGVANAWFDAVNQGAPPDSAIDAAGYACSGSMSGQRASVTCTGGDGRQVSFTASP